MSLRGAHYRLSSALGTTMRAGRLRGVGTWRLVLCPPRPLPVLPRATTSLMSLRWSSRRPNADDPYSLLGVPRGMDDRDYKVAYLKLAKTCHPDLHPNDAEATQRFQRLSVACKSRLFPLSCLQTNASRRRRHVPTTIASSSRRTSPAALAAEGAATLRRKRRRRGKKP